MSNEIDFSKPLQTREGHPVRIYAADGGGSKPIHGAYQLCGHWYSLDWLSSGIFQTDTLQTDLDLVNVKTKHKKFIGLYKENDSGDVYAGANLYNDAGDVDINRRFVATATIEWEE